MAIVYIFDGLIVLLLIENRVSLKSIELRCRYAPVPAAAFPYSKTFFNKPQTVEALTFLRGDILR